MCVYSSPYSSVHTVVCAPSLPFENIQLNSIWSKSCSKEKCYMSMQRDAYSEIEKVTWFCGLQGNNVYHPS